MMKLLDLPPEILQSIAEEIVIALGPFEAQRVRLVNSMFVCAWSGIRTCWLIH